MSGPLLTRLTRNSRISDSAETIFLLQFPSFLGRGASNQKSTILKRQCYPRPALEPIDEFRLWIWRFSEPEVLGSFEIPACP